MFSHVVLGANDIAEAKRFYDAILGVLGAPEGVIDPWGRLVYSHEGSRFLLTRPLNGEPATHANGGTLGFAATSIEQADAWHAAGLAHGGFIEYHAVAVRMCQQLFTGLPVPRQGWLALPQQPGLGFAPDWAAIAALAQAPLSRGAGKA